MLKSAGILGTGKYVPSKVVTNDDIVAMGIDTTDDWIFSRTGIRERRVTESDMASSDMAFFAAQQAIQNSGVAVADIDLVIVATTSGDYLGFPSVACLIQDRLGLRPVGAFDVAAACSGFSYGLSIASQFVAAGTAKYVLVVGTDCLSKYVDWTDRSICILFGDGAGAVVVGETSENHGILASHLFSSGKEAPILMMKGGGSRNPFSESVLAEKSHLIHMEGRAVFKTAVNAIVPAIDETLAKAGLTSADVDLLVMHQANVRIIEMAREKLGLPESKVFINLDRYGNTSAASIPIALAEAVEMGRLKPGMVVVTVGFGAGFTWGVHIMRWGVEHA